MSEPADKYADYCATSFMGFKAVEALRASKLTDVPRRQGVYLVLRPDDAAPVFLSHSTGGRFKGRDPREDVTALATKWVAGATVLYIGKAGGLGRASTLRSRLSLYLRFGAGVACGHWGGRYIWQLANAESLVICWKPLNAEEPRDVEAQMIKDFVACYGKLPFANCVG